MTPEQALAEVNEAGKVGIYNISTHAREQGSQRGAGENEIRSALATAYRATYQTDSGRWKVTGKDVDEDDLTLIVAFDSGVVVVTVF